MCCLLCAACCPRCSPSCCPCAEGGLLETPSNKGKGKEPAGERTCRLPLQLPCCLLPAECHLTAWPAGVGEKRAAPSADGDGVDGPTSRPGEQ